MPTDAHPAADPKIELHLHLEGAVHPASLLQIARRNGVPLPVSTEEDLSKLYEFRDFPHFLEVWVMTTNCLRTADDFAQIVVDYAAEAATYGAVYVEAIFSPAERMLRGIDGDELFTGYTDGAVEAQERHGVTVRFTPDLYRTMPDLDIAEQVAQLCVKYAERGVVGLGVGGMEAGNPLAPFVRCFEIARDGGLGLVPHAGEAAGPDSIREALSYRPARLRHGIRAVDDPDLMTEIAERGIVLDVCPTSNLRTRVVPSLAEHPLPTLVAAGIQCTINTDDPAMFNTDLGQEYALAAQLGVTAQDAYAAGLAGALCDEPTLQRLTALTAD
ncbi:MAG: adenosine deaminase [Micromonosporaceae bacterium]